MPKSKVDICPHCHEPKTHIQRHIKEVHTKVKVTCPICGDELVSQHNLRGHIERKHTETDKIECPYPKCTRMLKSEATLKQHIQNKHGNQPPLSCPICSKTKKNKITLQRHIDGVHNQIRPYVCKFEGCTQSFAQSGQLTSHTLTHTQEKPHKCEHCSKTFNRKSELKVHIRSRHTDEKPHRCAVCDYSCADPSALRVHVQSHSTDKPYKCNSCSFACKTARGLKSHQTVHSSIPMYACHFCKKPFKRKQGCIHHEKRKHTNDKKFICTFEDCQHKYVTKAELNTHVEGHSVPLPCPLNCGYGPFKTKNILRLHIQHIHNGVRAHKCTQCDRAFYMSGSLKSHIRTHTGEKPYPCQFPNCGAKFRQRAALAVHENYHFEIRKFCCEFDHCGRAFFSKAHLDEHTRVHTGDRPFCCDYPSCEKAFKTLSACRQHFQSKHTNERPHLCEYENEEGHRCGRRFAHARQLRYHESGFHLGPCLTCISAGQSETTANRIHHKFAHLNLCLTCAQFKFGMEVAFRAEHLMADYINRRFLKHPEVISIYFNREDPDENKCTRMRMDVRILTHTRGCVVVEVDEKQHASYLCSIKDVQEKWTDLQLSRATALQRGIIKEASRLNVLATTGTIEKMPVFRLNPDRFTDEHGRKIEPHQIIDDNGDVVPLHLPDARNWRFDMLGDDLERYLVGDPDMERPEFIPVFKYFFDGKLVQETFAPVDPDEYKSWTEQLLQNKQPEFDGPNPDPSPYPQ